MNCNYLNFCILQNFHPVDFKKNSETPFSIFQTGKWDDKRPKNLMLELGPDGHISRMHCPMSLGEMSLIM